MAAGCSDLDRPRGEADETIAVVERQPEREAAGVAVAAGCTSPEPSVVGVGGIYARCRPGRCQDQQRSAVPLRTRLPSVAAAAVAGSASVDCDSDEDEDGGIVVTTVVVCVVECTVTTMSYWKRLVSR